MRKKTKERIDHINKLLKQYGEMTVRQIYYQLVGVIPINYRQVIYACKLGRREGLISWGAIVDRARPIYSVGRQFEDGSDFIEAIVNYFHLNYWQDSKNEVELWTEKDALSQILFGIAEQYHVTVRVTRGFLSLSNKKRWGRKGLTILYFGDHDPSGLYIDKDLSWEVAFENFKRIALTMEQITEHSLPSVKVNRADPRAPGYLAEYGSEGWELDALPPDVLKELVKNSIEEYVDFDLDEKKIEEAGIRTELNELAWKWRDEI